MANTTIPILIPINTGENKTNLEKCLSKSENLDIAQKYNFQQELNAEEQSRLTTCVQQVEHDTGVVTGVVATVGFSLLGVLVLVLIGIVIYEIRN